MELITPYRFICIVFISPLSTFRIANEFAFESYPTISPLRDANTSDDDGNRIFTI